MTANGVTETDQKVDLVINEMKDTTSPFAMASVLSIVFLYFLKMAMIFCGGPGTNLSCSMIGNL